MHKLLALLFFVVYGQDMKHKSGRLHPLQRICVQKQTSAPPVWTGRECKQIVDTFLRTDQNTQFQVNPLHLWWYWTTTTLKGGNSWILPIQQTLLIEPGTYAMKSEDIQILRREFFSQPCTSLAPALLGQLLCRKLPSGIILRAEVTSSIMEIGEVLQWKFFRLLRQEHTLTHNWFNQPKWIVKFPQIVETEAYPAGCPRVPKATHGPGSTFIYSIYGVIVPY